MSNAFADDDDFDPNRVFGDDLSSNPFADMQSSSVNVFASQDQPFDAGATSDALSQSQDIGAPSVFSTASPPTPSTAFPTPAIERQPIVDELTTLDESLTTPLNVDPVRADPVQASHAPNRPSVDMSALLGESEQPSVVVRKPKETNGSTVLPVSSIGRKPVGGALASLLGVEPDQAELKREEERRRIQRELLAQQSKESKVRPTPATQVPLPVSRPDSGLSHRVEPQASTSLPVDGGHQGTARTEQPHYRTPTESASRPAPERSFSSSSNVNKDLPISPAAVTPGQIRVSVGDPHKVGSVGSQHVLYTVKTKTTSAAFRKSEFSVLRRFTHFLWLYDALTSNNPGVIVPAMPEKSVLGRFDRDFVEHRRQALQAALSKIVSHPLLAGDPDLRLFLESDSFDVEIKQRKIEASSDGKGLLSSLTSFSSSSKFVETDEFFIEQRKWIEQSQVQLKALTVTFENYYKAREALRVGLLDLHAALLAISQSDLSSPLRSAFERLAVLQKQVANISLDQDSAEREADGVASVLDLHARSSDSVRLAFETRGKTYIASQTADATLLKIRTAQDKARRGGYLSPSAAVELSEAQRNASDAKHEFEDVTRLLRSELARFDKSRIEDVKTALELYINGVIKRQTLVVKLWADFRDALQSIVKQNASNGP